MKKIGKVSHITNKKRIMVKAEIIPKLFTEVFNLNKKPIGKVIDVLGPIKEPFIAVKPYSKDKIEQYIGQTLYIKEE